MGSNNQNNLVAFIGVAASGKTTMVERVRDKHGFFYIPSVTTRTKRSHSNGDYKHVTVEEFDRSVKNGDFLEYTQIAGHYYGRLKSDFEDGLRKGHCTLAMTADRVKELKKIFPHATFICVNPDSPFLAVVEKRLRNRGFHTEEEIQKKIQSAVEELEIIKELDREGYIDHHIVTKEDDWNHAANTLDAIILEKNWASRHSETV